MNMIWGSVREPELNAYLSQWAAAKLFPVGEGFSDCTTLGVFDGPKLVAVMVYHNWHKSHGVIEMSGASTTPHWLKRPVLQEMFSYPFDQLGCQMVLMRVDAKDERLARQLTAVGFKGYKIARLRGRSEDEIVFTLTDDDWRNNGFQKKVIGNGQEVGSDAA